MCDSREDGRYQDYVQSMTRAGVKPHSYAAWKRVQEVAPPSEQILDDATASPEQQVIDASHRAYFKHIAECYGPRPTFEQWLREENILYKHFIKIVYKVGDEFVTEILTGNIAREFRAAIERAPHTLSFAFLVRPAK
jgi:hypothetical protein